MKKVSFILGNFLVTAILLSSCSPSACDCYKDVYASSMGSADYKMVQKCIKKYGSHIPSSYKGSNKFTDKMQKALRKECSSWEDNHSPSELRGIRNRGNKSITLDKIFIDSAGTQVVGQEFNISAVGNTMQDMKYDIENITVKEDSWVRITLKNEGVDAAMLHNILFVNFGKRKDLAVKATEAGSAKEFIPEDENLIAASKLAKPGETVVLEFQAPKKGNYEFFCSYPGHAMMMRGYFFVK